MLSRDEQIRQEFLDDLRREGRVLIEASRGIELASAFWTDPVVADKLLVHIGALIGCAQSSPQRMHFAACFNDVIMADLLGFFPLPDAFTWQSIAPSAVGALIYIKGLTLLFGEKRRDFVGAVPDRGIVLVLVCGNLGLPQLLVLLVCDFARGDR